MPPFLCCPDEILSKIFLAIRCNRTLVLSLPLVCQRFRRIMAESVGAVDLDFTWALTTPGAALMMNPMTDDGLAAALGRFRSVRSLKLTHSALITYVLCTK